MTPTQKEFADSYQAARILMSSLVNVDLETCPSMVSSLTDKLAQAVQVMVCAAEMNRYEVAERESDSLKRSAKRAAARKALGQ
jgi:hypothetical protein